MKRIFLSILFLFPLFVAAQNPDSIAAQFSEPYTDVVDLSQKLTAPFTTEADNARVLFLWVAHNVDYNCYKYRNPKPKPRISATSEEELAQKIEQYRAEGVAKTLETGRGICEDYSRLYHALCAAAGLESVVVTGHARDFHKPYRKALDNPHAWNAIKIDGTWYLCDPTWAAGHTNGEVTRFTRKLSPGFFKTPPAWFAQTHFPDDEQWQLLDHPLSKKAFADQPLVNIGQADYIMEDFSPNVESVPGEKGMLQLRFKFINGPDKFMVANAKRKPIQSTTSYADGWAIIQFPRRSGGEVYVWGGEEGSRKASWIGRFSIN